MSGRPRILFIARAFPPTVGGMENLAFQLERNMRAHADVTSIINHHGKIALPAFLPLAFARALREISAGNVDAVHLADALLAPLGAALRRITGVPVTTSVCGLDVTYANPVYQCVVPRALARLDLALPISAATEAAMRARTGARPPSMVVPLGVNPLPEPDAAAMAKFRKLLDAPEGAPVVLTVGRLIERKGHAWCVREVLPLLPPETIYVIVGEGPQRDAIVAAARDAGVEHRVRLLGRLPAPLMSAAYRTADVFLMPNVPVAGDMEGFGLVALEAAASALPVVAARLEGISEAVQHDRNGILVAPGDTQAFAAAVRDLLSLAPTARHSLGAFFSMYTRSNYGWDVTARRYVEAIDEAARGRTDAPPLERAA